MRSVHKHPFSHLSQPLQVQCSRLAKVVLVDTQGGVPTVWIDDERDEAIHTMRRNFMVIGTGHPIPDGATHVGSLMQGAFVWHVYQLQP